MSNWVECGWDCALQAAGVGLSLSLTSTDLGATPLNMATGTYAHVDLSASVGPVYGFYSAFAAAFQTAMNALENKYTVTFSATTGLYTITRSSGVFTLTFAATDTAIAMRRVLGFSATTGSAISHVSDVRPYYWIFPALPAIGRSSRAYHGGTVAAGGISATGIGSGLAVDTPAKYEDLTFMAESNTATLDDDLVAGVPFTWEGLFAHATNQHPVAYHSGTNPGRIYQLRPDDGAPFNEQNRERLESDWDAAWHVTLRGLRLGTFTI